MSKKNQKNKTRRIASNLTDEDRCEILETILNKSGLAFSDAERDRIGELYGDLMDYIG